MRFIGFREGFGFGGGIFCSPVELEFQVVQGLGQAYFGQRRPYGFHLLRQRDVYRLVGVEAIGSAQTGHHVFGADVQGLLERGGEIRAGKPRFPGSSAEGFQHVGAFVQPAPRAAATMPKSGIRQAMVTTGNSPQPFFDETIGMVYLLRIV